MASGDIDAKALRDYIESLKNPKSDAFKHRISESLGILGSVGLPGMVTGASTLATGGSIRDLEDTVVPAMIGGSLANAIGMVAAAITKRRTLKDQEKADKRSVLWNMIPGVAAYNSAKRTGLNMHLGRSLGKRDKGGEKSEKKAAFDVDWSKIKGNVNWEAIKQKLTEAKQWYEGQSPETRALIGAGVGLGGGALLGKLMGRTGTGALAGTLAGAGAGAYWKDIKKAIEAAKPGISDALSAAKPVVENATQKTKERIDAIAKKLGVTDKKNGTENSATAKALASTGVAGTP